MTKTTPEPESFDLSEWLDSVEGRTVRVTTPDELGPEASRLTTSPAHYSVPYCNDCDEHVRLIKTGGDAIGNCPMCGSKPGALELGTRRKA